MALEDYEKTLSKLQMLGHKVWRENEDYLVTRKDTLWVLSKSSGKVYDTPYNIVTGAGVLELSNHFTDNDNTAYIFTKECGEDKLIVGPYRGKVKSIRSCPIYILINPDYTLTIRSTSTRKELKLEAFSSTLEFMLRKQFLLYVSVASEDGGLRYHIRPDDYPQLGVSLDEFLNIISINGGYKVTEVK